MFEYSLHENQRYIDVKKQRLLRPSKNLRFQTKKFTSCFIFVVFDRLVLSLMFQFSFEFRFY